MVKKRVFDNTHTRMQACMHPPHTHTHTFCIHSDHRYLPKSSANASVLSYSLFPVPPDLYALDLFYFIFFFAIEPLIFIYCFFNASTFGFLYIFMKFSMLSLDFVQTDALIFTQMSFHGVK